MQVSRLLRAILDQLRRDIDSGSDQDQRRNLERDVDTRRSA
jgi:hypothetical protein